MIYWFNLIVLFGTFIMSLSLFFVLFQSNSIAYKLPAAKKWALKAFVIMLCLGQLHAMEGDKMDEINIHDLMRDMGMFGFLGFVHFHLLNWKK